MPTITTRIDIPDERVNDLLCSAFEGGSTYWCAEVDSAYTYCIKTPEFFSEWPMQDLVLKLTTHNPEDDPKPALLDRAACERGLNLMANHHPNHFADLLAENDDANTGDVFLQLAVFGEVIFG